MEKKTASIKAESDGILLYCGRVPAANVPGCPAAEGLLYNPGL